MNFIAMITVCFYIIGIPMMFTGCNNKFMYNCKSFNGQIYKSYVRSHRKKNGKIYYFPIAIGKEKNGKNKTLSVCKIYKGATTDEQEANLIVANDLYVGKPIKKYINPNTNICKHTTDKFETQFYVGFCFTLVAILLTICQMFDMINLKITQYYILLFSTKN